MSKKPILLAVLLGTVALAGCAAPADPTSVSTLSPTAEPHDEAMPEPSASWDAASESSAKSTASKVIGLFGRPSIPEKVWFRDLKPFLGKEYAESASYIDPAKVPFHQVLDGPVLNREKGNPATVTATFMTDAGLWDVLLHRSAQSAPWVVMQISAHQGN